MPKQADQDGAAKQAKPEKNVDKLDDKKSQAKTSAAKKDGFAAQEAALKPKEEAGKKEGGGAGVVPLTGKNFDAEALAGDTPVLVGFWAKWSGPSRQQLPTMSTLASQLSGRLRVASVDCDDEQELAERFGVKSPPHLMLFKGGSSVEANVGSASLARLLAMVEKHL